LNVSVFLFYLFFQNQRFLGTYCHDIPYIATFLLLQQYLHEYRTLLSTFYSSAILVYPFHKVECITSWVFFKSKLILL